MLGLRVRIGSRWFFEGVARLNQHLADWKLQDLESGSSGVIDDYTLKGVHLGLGYSF